MNIIVSACLLGVNCRYDGGSSTRTDIVEALRGHTIIPVCPEQLGGLMTPRPPSEIVGDRVVSVEGLDVTLAFQNGALEALKIAELSGSSFAILKARSPSCGSDEVYDGSFSGKTIKGSGVTAKLFKAQGIEVHNEENYLDLLKKI